ncbi:hypothetical protein [Terrisporobacter glycolicus]|uniref:hypothetical protein n=1 Tax=Terrisporobacter glycolicus TaxID=36841 RepID=UPI000A9799A2
MSVAGCEFAYAFVCCRRGHAFICGWFLILSYISTVALNPSALSLLLKCIYNYEKWIFILTGWMGYI